jgi:uncharacterized protein (DUF433 family)
LIGLPGLNPTRRFAGGDLPVLDFGSGRCHTSRPCAGVAQWLERRPVTPEAAGSSPVIRAIKLNTKRDSDFPTSKGSSAQVVSDERATVAQSVEHSTENARVPGSSPGCGTTISSAVTKANMTIDQALWQDADRVGGAVCFRDTRIPVSTLFDYLEARDIAGFFENYPDVSSEMVEAILETAKNRLKSVSQNLVESLRKSIEADRDRLDRKEK